MSYPLLNGLMLIPALLLLAATVRKVNLPELGWTLAVLILLTVGFDNFIVGSGIVGYDESLISGIKVGYAPIEDFAYTLFAGIVIPISWWIAGRRK